MQNIDQERVWGRFYREKFFIALIPGKSVVQLFSIFTNAFFVVEMKWCRIRFDNLFQLFFCYEWFFHDPISSHAAYIQRKCPQGCILRPLRAYILVCLSFFYYKTGQTKLSIPYFENLRSAACISAEK